MAATPYVISLRRFSLSVAIAITFSALAFGQTEEIRFPVAGTTIRNTPMFWARGADRSPIVLLPADTTVLVTAREGPWFKVVSHDPRFGDQTGYVSPYDIRIDPDASPSEIKGAPKLSQRGLIEGRGFGFPENATNDVTHLVGDALFRDEVFLRPKRWLQFAGGLDLRANSPGQVEDQWRLDFSDRSILRPRAAVRRLTAAITTRHVTVDMGKQFIRWGRADILSPTDRFAPRDYVNVIDTELLPVLGVRTSVHAAAETFEAVIVPRLTPSRLPLLGQRWTIVPPEATGFVLVDKGSEIPKASETGVHWSHSGRVEMGLSFFNGFNHLPDIGVAVDPTRGVIALTREYPKLRTYGGDILVPTRWLNVKAETAYFSSPTPTNDEYVLYVVEGERQTGDWLVDVGYAGEAVTRSVGERSFAAERGMARSIIGRASYSVDPRRSVVFEAAVRQTGHGVYGRGEYTQAFRGHWRWTLAAVVIGGDAQDFLGQYQRNSHVSTALRFSF